MKKMFLSVWALVAFVAPAMAGVAWVTDLPAALEQAAKENKAVMVDFNGSDWCGPCIALKSKVLDTPAFAAYAKDKLILVDIDVPRGDQLSVEQKVKNKAVCDAYAIRNYPTILVLNKDGMVVGGFVGAKSNIAHVQVALDAALINVPKADEAMTAAAGLTGVGKAQALMAAYNLVPESIRANNAALRTQIIEADPSDTCGLLSAEEAKLEKVKIQNQVMASVFAVPVAERVALIEKELACADLSVNHRLALQAMKLQVGIYACESSADLAAIRLACQDFAEDNPSEKEAVDHLLTGFLAKEDAELLKLLEAIRVRESTQKVRAMMWLL